MDATKLKVLRDLDYKVQKTCGLCIHGVFPVNDWGTCQKHEYQHEKHTGGARKLSIVKYGSCKDFKEYDSSGATLGAYQEFLK